MILRRKGKRVGIVIFIRQRPVANRTHVDGGGVKLFELFVRHHRFEHRHLAIGFAQKQVHHLVGQGGRKTTVVFAALPGAGKIARNLRTGVQAQTARNLAGHHAAHTAETRVSVFVALRAGKHHFGLAGFFVIPTNPFRHRHNEVALGVAHIKFVYSFKEEIFAFAGNLHFGNEGNVRPAKGSRTGKPARVAAHHFHHHHTRVRLGGSLNHIRQAGHRARRRRKAGADNRFYRLAVHLVHGAGAKVVVNRFGETDNRNALLFVEFLGRAVGVVATNGYQNIYLVAFEVFHDLGHTVFARLGRKRVGAARTQGCAAIATIVGLTSQIHHIAVAQKTFPALTNTIDFVAQHRSPIAHGFYTGIDGRRVATARKNGKRLALKEFVFPAHNCRFLIIHAPFPFRNKTTISQIYKNLRNYE